jgi:hypothetical protein
MYMKQCEGTDDQKFAHVVNNDDKKIRDKYLKE